MSNLSDTLGVHSRDRGVTMLAIWVKVKINATLRDKFLEAIEADALASEREEPGCLRFNVFQDEKDENVYYLFEVYKDQAALEAHCKTPHYALWRGVADILEGALVLPSPPPQSGAWAGSGGGGCDGWLTRSDSGPRNPSGAGRSSRPPPHTGGWSQTIAREISGSRVQLAHVPQPPPKRPALTRSPDPSAARSDLRDRQAEGPGPTCAPGSLPFSPGTRPGPPGGAPPPGRPRTPSGGNAPRTGR